MGYTCLLCVIIISFCHESMGKNIYLTEYRNGSWKKLDTSSNPITIRFDEGEFLKIVCTADGEQLSWDSEDTSSLNEIKYIGTLQKSHDGVEKICHTVTNDLSISFKFVKNMNEMEILQAKPNAFKILLICLGGVVVVALLLLSGYALLRCCMNSRKKRREVDTDSTHLEAPTYAEIDKTMKKQHQEESVDYCEVGILGIDNVSCQIEEKAKPNIIDSSAHSENSIVETDRSMSCVNISDVDTDKVDRHDIENENVSVTSAAQEIYPRSVKLVQNNGNAHMLFKHNNVNEELKKRLTLNKFGSSSDC